jgi:hypothetical protein
VADNSADTKETLETAGYANINITPNDLSRDLIQQWAPAESREALDYVVSATIAAVKPATATF